MLSIGLISLLVAIPIFSYRITPSLFHRITSVVLLYSALLAFHGLHVESLASGVGIYSGLFHVKKVSLGTEAFLLFTGALISSYTGLTQFESLSSLVQVTGSDSFSNPLGVTSGLLLIGIGFLFQVAAAPLHNWAPDGWCTNNCYVMANYNA